MEDALIEIGNDIELPIDPEAHKGLFLNTHSLFFIMGPCHLNVLQVIYHYIHIYEHITYTTVNIRIGMSDPSVA
jgi:hypothetical protein